MIRGDIVCTDQTPGSHIACPHQQMAANQPLTKITDWSKVMLPATPLAIEFWFGLNFALDGSSQLEGRVARVVEVQVYTKPKRLEADVCISTAKSKQGFSVK